MPATSPPCPCPCSSCPSRCISWSCPRGPDATPLASRPLSTNLATISSASNAVGSPLFFLRPPSAPKNKQTNTCAVRFVGCGLVLVAGLACSFCPLPSPTLDVPVASPVFVLAVCAMRQTARIIAGFCCLPSRPCVPERAVHHCRLPVHVQEPFVPPCRAWRSEAFQGTFHLRTCPCPVYIALPAAQHCPVHGGGATSYTIDLATRSSRSICLQVRIHTYMYRRSS